jgi:FkbM family methyltransferase
MSLAARLNRPEYLFSPRAVLKRLRRGRGHPGNGTTTTNVRLPWAQEITVFPDEIGRTIIACGIFDLCVTETIHRLVDRGDLAVDVGANVGYLTNVMATRAGRTGRVVAFEPHPTVFEILERNARRWDADARGAAIEARRFALSNRAGIGHLQSEGSAEAHMGLSSLRAAGESRASNEFEVELARLDDLFVDGPPKLLKIDVEGHEHKVLEGAQTMLDQGQIRDVVFEEHAIYPAPSMIFLEQRGMTLFTLKHSLFGLRVHPIEEGPAPPLWPGPNYLATLDPERALRLLRPRGWETLGGLARLGRSAG